MERKIFLSKSIFDMSILDIYFCPFLKSQNTFHFLKSSIIPSYVGKKKRIFSTNLKIFSSLCSVIVFKFFYKIYYFHKIIKHAITFCYFNYNILVSISLIPQLKHYLFSLLRWKLAYFLHLCLYIMFLSCAVI